MPPSLKSPPTPFFFLVLFGVLMTVIFNYTLGMMASPYILLDLGGSTDIASYPVTFFALGNALGVPLGRNLMFRIGPARMLVGVLGLFAFFSFLSGEATTFPFFNAARFLQGFVSGPFYALFFYFLSCLQPQEKKRLFTAFAVIIFTIFPVIGACWGGVVAYLGNWRWCYYIDMPITLFMMLYFYFRLKGFTEEKAPNPPLDIVGYLAFFIGVFTLGFVVIMGQ